VCRLTGSGPWRLTHPDSCESGRLAVRGRGHGQQQQQQEEEEEVNRQQQRWQSRHLPLLLMEKGRLAACTAT